MRFFSKFIFLCNICFVASIVLRYLENSKKKTGHVDAVIKLAPLQNSLVILGYTAIIFNFIYHLILLGNFASKSKNNISKWMICLNFLFLIAQIYYFFFYE